MSELKCQHEWEYFDEHDFPNGYEYEQWNIPHKRCKKCGREYELFDGYGEYAKRWRKVEFWSLELHKLEQELIRTRKALDYAIDVIQTVAKMSDKLSRKYGETLVEQLDNIQMYCWQEGYVLTHEEDLEKAITALEQKDVK